MSRSIPGNSLTALAVLFLTSCPAMGQVADSPATENAEGSAATFELPEKFENFEALMTFVQEIGAKEPAEQSRASLEMHHRKVARTIVAATERTTDEGLTNQDAMQRVYLQLQGLQILQQLGEPKTEAKLSKAIDLALTNKSADVQAVGVKFMVESGFGNWATWNNEDKKTWIQRIAKHIQSNSPAAQQIETITAVLDFVGERGGAKLADELTKSVLPHFQSSDDPQLKQSLPMLEGVNRRLQLTGNEIQLQGTLLDGTELDWKSYRGKVVLVDFWATWCGPCRAEVPNILKMYQAYHDKGFEVLGISLDNSPEEAEGYIKQSNIPWPTLFSSKASERGWRHPMAVRYGITGIPRAILVDRDGKVVHMTARGPLLEKELRRLLGEPVAYSHPSNSGSVVPVKYSPAE